MAKKQKYEVAQDGFLAGDYHRAGETVEMYPEQAAYDLPPHGSMLKAPAATTAAVASNPAKPKKTQD